MPLNIHYTESRKLFWKHLLTCTAVYLCFCNSAYALQSIDTLQNYQPIDSVSVTNLKNTITTDSLVAYFFDGSDYKAAAYNSKVAINEDGIVFFGNENGLLEFDGSNWQLHQNNNFGAVINLKIIEDKIYVSDGFEIGYYQRDGNGIMRYTTILNQLADGNEYTSIWYIFELKGKVYFSSYEHLVIWDGEINKKIPVKLSHAFKIGDEVILSIYEKGLARLVGDTIEMVNTDFKFKDDAAFNIEKNALGEWIIYTSESGFFKYDSLSYQTEKLETEASKYFESGNRALFGYERLNDSVMIASTWENGFVFFNERGEVIRTMDKSDGLKMNYALSMKVDRRGNIWLATVLGVNYIRRVGISPYDYNFQPKSLVRTIINDDSTLYVRNDKEVIDVPHGKNKSLTFRYATPSFLKGELEYAYYLEGFEEGYSQWTQEVRKEYTNLSGGSYKFHVKSRYLTNLKLVILPFSTTINIPTPWYENQWSYFYLALVVTALVFAFIRIRTQSLKNINKRLEDLVDERTSQLLEQQVELKDAYDELTVINNELDNFVYRSSHDLVAPLKSLRGLIQIAQQEAAEEQKKFYFELMNTSINKLEEFIKSIMDFSTNSKKPIEYKEVSLTDVIDSIVQDIKYYTNSEKVELKRSFGKDFILETDAKRLHIILSNLITNAVKYHNYDQDVQAYVEVIATKKEEYYQLIVKDNGQGIPEEFHDKIFDMFFRAHQGSEGSGLGLYIVVDTLKVLQGEIDFTSKLRQGTQFVIKLPFKKHIF
ncbi:MAG: signal transduction histidine kinase [Marivirga sp.]|jgi:signal transduction histidine kinase